MKLTQKFAADYQEVIAAVERGGRFAIARFNTGEWPMVRGLEAHGRGSGWSAKPERNRTYYEAMKAAWECERPEWHVGISCPCCNPPEYLWYKANLHVPMERVTFATVFMGSNWPAFREWLLKRRGDYILVGPKGEGKLKPDFEVPRNCFQPESWDWTKLRENLAQTMNGSPVMFAAGPLGKILCHELMSASKGPLVDIGSALDLDIFKIATRAYLRKPLKRRRFKSKKAKKNNERSKRLWMRTCVWKLADKPIHKV